MTEEVLDELELYHRLAGLGMNAYFGQEEELRTTPLLTLGVKDAIGKSLENVDSCPRQSIDTPREKLIRQYALLGFHVGRHPAIHEKEPILLNVDAPNSAFICGSQGSGKSYTLNCMLEDCLVADRRLGRVTSPVAGLAFQYDLDSAQSVAETAYLCSMGVRVKVFVSQGYEQVLRKAYGRLPGAGENLTVSPLLFTPSDLSIERMHKLMAFSDHGSSVPLYMSVALRILRQMAKDAGGASFDYLAFKKALASENLTKEQSGPLNLRLELLESFMDLSRKSASVPTSSIVEMEPGTMTIIDLTDPFMDPATACILFDISLSLFKERRPSCGLVIALDEAHKYMTSSLEASNLTERLLGTIREQRHNGTRVIIATQEPTISEKLLDLCTTSIIHRFTSPAWFASLRNHLGGASGNMTSAVEQHDLFDEIVDLKVGESLVFAPSAFVCVSATGEVRKLGRAIMKMMTRARLGSDGGASVLASGRSHSQVNGKKPLRNYGQSSIESQRIETPLKASVVTAQENVSGVASLKAEPEGVAIMKEAKSKSSTKRKSALSKQRSHLVLICCSCKELIIAEFPQRNMPKFTNMIWADLRAGMAYTTCVTCRSRKITLTKKASKDFDMRTRGSFMNDANQKDTDLQGTLQTVLQPLFGCALTMILDSNQPAYLWMRSVQRSFDEATLLWTARLPVEDSSDQDISLTQHRDGTFFDSSLRPNNGT